MSASERLLIRLKDECGLSVPAGARIKRLYPGRHQKAKGHWLWKIEGGGYGSPDRVCDCLRAKRLVVRGEDIYVE